jgi:hypothetical protein
VSLEKIATGSVSIKRRAVPSNYVDRATMRVEQLCGSSNYAGRATMRVEQLCGSSNYIEKEAMNAIIILFSD